MAADMDALLAGIAAINLGAGDLIQIPVNIFDACKHLNDPHHGELGEFMLFNFCVQSNINPQGVVRMNKRVWTVGGRFLFRLCLKVWLNVDDEDANNQFVEGTASGGNTLRQVEVVADLHHDGFHYVGPVPPGDSRVVKRYLPVGNRNNVYRMDLKNAIMRFQ